MNHYPINVTIAPRPVRMNIATWKSLSDSDQKSWDNVTEDEKSKISTTMSSVLHVHVLDHRIMDNVAHRPTIYCRTQRHV
jgi:N-glycosylase/DNA lyase